MPNTFNFGDKDRKYELDNPFLWWPHNRIKGLYHRWQEGFGRMAGRLTAEQASGPESSLHLGEREWDGWFCLETPL